MIWPESVARAWVIPGESPLSSALSDGLLSRSYGPRRRSRLIAKCPVGMGTCGWVLAANPDFRAVAHKSRFMERDGEGMRGVERVTRVLKTIRGPSVVHPYQNEEH